MENKKILVTGGNGFIGHHFLDYLLNETNFEIFATYRSDSSNIPKDKRINLIKADLTQPLEADLPSLDYIVHMASATNVKESLDNSIPFIAPNILVTANLLEWIKKNHPSAKTCLFSSSEVLGPSSEGRSFKEEDSMKPSNPYAATKAASELLGYSFGKAFNIPIFIARCMNVFGEGDHEYKFIPQVVKKICHNQPITLHGKNRQEVASRNWIYVKDISDMTLFLLNKAKSLETYHLSGEEKSVYEIADWVYQAIKGEPLPEKMIEFVDFKDTRPGHDKKYSLSNQKIKSLGWSSKYPLEENVKKVAKYLYSLEEE